MANRSQPEVRDALAVEIRAADEAHISRLIAAKVRFVAPLIAIYLVGYIGLTVLAGFAKELMAVRVVGAVNVGFVLIALNYLMAWVLALIYVRRANNVFDRLVERARPFRKRTLEDGARK